MAKMVLKAAHLSLNGVDRSDWCNKIELTAEVEEKEVTTFASLGWREVIGGIASGQLAVAFRNDVDAGALDETMWALFTAGSVVPFEVRASNAPVSASNPAYSGQVLVKEWKPIVGNVGDVNELDVTFPTSGPITRATS